MALPDDRGEFEAAVRAAVAAVLPTGRVEVVARTLVVIKLRVDLDTECFIDIFFNSRNRRTDLSLVRNGRRVFGYDNLGQWHCHPAVAPERHVACGEPDLAEFVRAAVRLSRA